MGSGYNHSSQYTASVYNFFKNGVFVCMWGRGVSGSAIPGQNNPLSALLLFTFKQRETP